MDWRTDKELFNFIMMNNTPPGQALYKSDREAARKDDINNNRGFLVVNPDLDTQGLDVDGLIIKRPGEEHEGEEYRVVIDPNMKGMKDPETGEVRAGFWLKPFPSMQILPIVPFPPGIGSGRYDNEWANPEPAVFVGPSIFAEEDDNEA